MSKNAGKRDPWFKFYTMDWRGDFALGGCGLAAKGLWIDMLSLMHEATPYGHLLSNGKLIDVKRLAGVTQSTTAEVSKLLQILESAGVFSRTDDGVIYSRRMIEDNRKAEADRVNGKAGGNPKLKASGGNGSGHDPNGGVNPGYNHTENGLDKAQIPEAKVREKELALFQSPLPEKRLWDEGLPILSQLLAEPPKRCEKALGALLTAFKKPEPLLAALVEASTMELEKPYGWLMSRAKGSSGQPKNPCAADPPDAWKHLAEAYEIESKSGILRPTVHGSFLDLTAGAVADAAGMPSDRCMDWKPLVAWMRSGMDGDVILRAIRRVASRPGYAPPASLAYFDNAVRERRAA